MRYPGSVLKKSKFVLQTKSMLQSPKSWSINRGNWLWLPVVHPGDCHITSNHPETIKYQLLMKYFQCCGLGDVSSGSRIRILPSRNPDPGSKRPLIRIRLKEFKYCIFNQKNCFSALENRIPDPIPDPWVKKAPDPDPDPQHWIYSDKT
jgi:hypothetical protein